jgi:hypothetical protein
MKLPTMLPSRPCHADTSAHVVQTHDRHRDAARSNHASVEAAGCCAQACINTPLGQVCHCVAEAPFC